MFSNSSGLDESFNNPKNVFINTEASTSQNEVNSPPLSPNRGRKHSLITNDSKIALPQLSFLVMADHDSANDSSEGSQTASMYCETPITSFKASPLFSYHYVEEEGDNPNLSTSKHHDLEDLDASVSSLNSLSRSHSGSVSSECLSLVCTSSSTSSTSLAILSKQKYDCEAAWKLRSALRDDASKIFQATWQEAERQKPILKKLVGTFKALLV